MSRRVEMLPRMSKKRRILVLVGLTLLLALCTAVTVVLYYVESPGKLKTLIEQSISRATGTECSIRELSYSLNPLFIHARGIQLIDHVRRSCLDIPELVTNLSLQGPFTRRSLVVKHLAITGLSLSTDRSFSLTETVDKPVVPDFFGRLARGLVALLLFRDIQVNEAELTGGRVSSEMGEQTLTMSGIHLSLNPDKSLQIACTGRLRWPSVDMEVTMPNLRLTADRAISIVDREIRISLKSEEMTVTAPRGKAESLSGEAQVVYDRDKKLLVFDSARLSSENVTFKPWNGPTYPSFAMKLDTDAFVDFSSGRAGAHRFHLVLNQIMEANGAFQAVTGVHPEVKLTGLVLQMTLQKTWPLLAEAFGRTPSSVGLGGVAYVTGNLDGLLKGNTWQWTCDLQARLEDSDVSFTTPDTHGRGKVTADLQVKGLYPAVDTALTLAVEKAELSWKGMGVKSAKAGFSASGKGLDFDVRNLNFQAPQAEFSLGGRRVQVPDISAQMQHGTIHSAQSQLSFPRIDLHTSLMKNLHLSVDAHEGQVIFALQGKESGIFSLARGLSLVPQAWQLGGLDSFLMKGTLKKDGHWLLESNWNLEQVAFQSPDVRYAGEKISLGLHLTASQSMNQKGWATSVEGSAVKGGLLYDRIYIDLQKNSLHFQLEGDYDVPDRTVNLSGFKFVLKDLLALEADGQLSDPLLHQPCHLRVRLPRMPLKPAFQLLLKEPLEQEVPFLAQLNVGGDLTAEMDFQKAVEGWRLLGHCSWRGGEILGKGFTLEGIEVDLPFWGESPGVSFDPFFKARFPSSRDFPKEGNLLIQSVALPYLPKQSLAARASITPNIISFTLQDSIKVPGGDIELDPISIKGLYTLSPSFVTGATLRESDLAPLLHELWPHPVAGTAQGRLDMVIFDGDRILTRGNLNVKAFGGEILLSNLGATGVLSSTPTLLLDATWKDINLAELTAGTPFDRIDGILRGHVKHLEVVAGEPQRFDLFMETVQTKEVPQKIGVRALENIAQIGGGGSPFIGLAGALTSLFKDFPYDKIAIQASLENDVFRIGGPLKEGDKVYLVKRSGFSGVNIINQNPDQRISFKDMMKRIKRVSASPGPVPAEEQNTKNGN
jgi:hypothetical protein